jgi:putative ABC transport system ATP-binding protein
MALLELERVTKLYRRGSRERLALADVSLQLEAGELVAVWGRHGSGRSTLLRVAAGIEQPDRGEVRFAGRLLSDGRRRVANSAIGYCQTAFRPAEGELVLDHLLARLLARGVPSESAQSIAHEALRRVGAEACAMLAPDELDGAELMRVAIARTLALEPKMLVIDEPTLGIEAPERDGVLQLLRQVADGGVAVLMSTGGLAASLAGADRALSLEDGELHGESAPELAPVVELRRSGRRASA